ncbi:NAD(P)H oxidoreductase [Glycomyces halotolerans]
MNTRPTALVVVAHHRPDSLTAHIGRKVADRLEAGGYRIDRMDLHAEGFDPRMTVADQPDWGDRDKIYSEEVRAHQARLLNAEVIVPVFPVYWFSLPAILKGWIDRVWGYGFAYGRSKPRLAGRRMLWLGLAGAAAGDSIAPVMKEALEGQLRDGISYYCGIAEAAVEILFDAEAQPQIVDESGNLTLGEELRGEARTAHYAEFERTAVAHVEKFLALP